MLQKAIAIIADPELKSQMLESIKLLQGSLSQTKHGQKVLNKMQKAYPHVFVGESASALLKQKTGVNASAGLGG